MWGGIALRQARQADELEHLGRVFYNDPDHFAVPGDEFCYDVPQETVTLGNGTLVFENHLPGVTPVCQFNAAKSSLSAYNVMNSFSYPESFAGDGLGPALSVIFIVAVAIYFATSSDSGSLIVDHLSANGRMHVSCLWGGEFVDCEFAKH